MTILTVGTDKQYQTIAAAIAASQSGDRIRVDAGIYTNDFAHITTNVSLISVGGLVHINATVPPPDGKAIFTIDANVKINGFEFSGAAVADNNGAGIRAQSGDLTLTNCWFHDNQEGILTHADPASDVVIDNCEFGFNGDGSGFTHGVYANGIKSLTITDSYFHDTSVGHEIKSRAATTTVSNNRIQDQAGSSSYSIDTPNGGNVSITGNVIEQGPFSENPYIIAYGEEGLWYASNSLLIDSNTILNDRATTQPLLLNPSGVLTKFSNNDVFGLTLGQLPNPQIGTVFLPVEPPLDTSHPFSVPTVDDLVLTGNGGRNTLIGGDGDDIFDGKGGKDRITTGGGNDTIIFSTPLAPSNVDTVTDFNNLQDTIQLKSTIFASLAGLGYNPSNGALSYEGTTFALLHPVGLTLDAINFKLV